MKNVQGGVHVIFKQAYIPRDGTLRVSFDCKMDYIDGFFRVYRNGAAVGTLHGSTVAYTNHTEDIVGESEANLVQVYAWREGGAQNGWVKNFRLTTSRAFMAYTTVV